MQEWRAALWHQLGAAIETLTNAIRACPDTLWDEGEPRRRFWYSAYHCLFFLDFYLEDEEEGFEPPHPFTMAEADPGGVLPDRTYTKDELLTYADHCRRKCRATLETVAEERAHQRCGFAAREMTVLELYLLTMRHVQHHAAQLNLLLRQSTDSAPPWVGQAAD